MKIKEIIVVEGKDDTTAIKRALNADTIETNGSAINQDTLNQIRLAQKVRGVIVFTDPDYPGERIRRIISQEVPGCQHAFLPKHLAIHKLGHGLGVEHASDEAIREALKNAKIMEEESEEVISKEDLILFGLIGGKGAAEKREKLGRYLNIGYANGKQLYTRLKMFGISKEEFLKAIEHINGVEKNE